MLWNWPTLQPDLGSPSIQAEPDRTSHPMLSRQRIRRWWSIGYLAVIEDRRIEMTARARPPFDADLEPALDAAPAFFTTLEPDSIAEFRAAIARSSSLEEVIAGRPIEVTDHAVTGHGGGEIFVTVLRR